MSVTWEILCIPPCFVNLMFTGLLNNQCIFLAALSCQYLSSMLVFMEHTLAYKNLPKNLKFVSSWDLVPRFLCLYINDCFCLPHLDFTIILSDLFMWWQASKSSGTTLTSFSDSTLQILSSKTFSWISAGTGLDSVVSCLLYWELVTALCSNWMILVSRSEFKLLHLLQLRTQFVVFWCQLVKPFRQVSLFCICVVDKAWIYVI